MRALIFLVALAVLMPLKEAMGCGFFILGDEYRVALFNPYLIGQEYELFFYSSEKFHPGSTAEVGRDRLRNGQEWADALGGAITAEDALELVYQTGLDDWRNAANGQPNSTFRSNPAWAAFNSQPALLKYLLWAKEYEKPADLQSYWWLDKEDVSAQKREDDALRQPARDGYAAAEPGSFLQKRWAYQLLLMAYYADDLPTADRLFTEHFEGERESVLADWARFHMANFYQDPVRKTIMLANAFRKVPEKAHAVFTRTPKEFKVEDYLAQTSSDFERSNLYALAAAKSPGRALALISKAHQFDPTNPVLDLLMSREINKLEDWLLAYRLTHMAPAVPAGYLEAEDDYKDIYFNNFLMRPEYIEKNYRRDRAYLKELRAFAEGFQSPIPALTPLYRAHLAMLDEDYNTAIGLLPAATTVDADLALQGDIIYFVSAIQQPGTDLAELRDIIAYRLPELEEAIAPPLGTKEREEYDNGYWYYGKNKENRNRSSALSRAASLQLEAARDTVGAYFMYVRSLPYTNGYGYSSQYYNIIDYLDRDVSYAVLDGVLGLLEGPPVDRFAGMVNNDDLVTSSMIRDVAGTVALRKNDLRRALDYFDGISDEWYAETYAFAENLRESPFVQPFEPTAPFPGKTKVVERLIDLEAVAQIPDEAGAAARYELANAWYNMSYYGSSWMMLTYGRSNYLSPGYLDWPFTNGHQGLPHHATHYQTAQLGQYAAQNLALASEIAEDPELLVRLEYLRGMLDWQVELTNLMKGYNWRRNFEDTSDSLYQAAFFPMKENFATTRFYQTVMNQCGTFADL